MTDDRDFDRLARAWLDLMPDEAPDRTVSAVLQAVETTPQVWRPWRRLPWRLPNMNRALLAATVVGAAVVAVGGGLWLSRSDDQTTGAPSPTPALSASPSGAPAASEGAGDPVPSALQAIWMGDHRDPVAADAGASIVLDGSDFHLVQSAGSNLQYLQSTASAAGDRQIRLVTKTDSNGCSKEDVGVYTWSLTPSGRVLTLTSEQDACSSRAGAITGDWWLMGCTIENDNCLGLLDAGTYKSQFITPRLEADATWRPMVGALTYTVPDGWANSSDWPDTFELVPAAELPPVAETDRRRNIGVFRQPSAMTQDRPCSDEVEPGVGRTVDDLTTWLGTVNGLVSTAPTPITIDGRAGQSLDLRLDPSWTATCEGGTEPLLTYLNPGLAVGEDQRVRLILLDLGDGDVVAIGVWTRDQATFDAFIPEAMQVIESFRFE
jgi:hypothetical protein